MSHAKVTLSPKELELVNDPGWILTKNRIIEKVYALFGGLSKEYQLLLAQNAVIEKELAAFRSPKIAKGEQYESLPWVLLDHPRYFQGQDVFAVRSFFWWGNFCSITLQLSGSYREKYAATVENYFFENEIDSERCKDWFICVNEDPWEHHFRKDNYRPVSEWSSKSFASLPFIKLAKKTSLNDWDNLTVFFEENYREILKMLTAF